MEDFDHSRFAVIADVHSNSDALAAVLRDIANQGIGSIVNLGDHLSGPMAARETADLLLSTGGHPDPTQCSVKWAPSRLSWNLHLANPPNFLTF